MGWGWLRPSGGGGARWAVGAPFNDGSGAGAGVAGVYRGGGGQWTRVGGVLDGPALDPGAGFKVALTAQQDVLRERRVAFYRWKGLAEKDLDAAVDGRAEEHETVAAAAARATLKVRLDGDLRLERDG